MTFVNLTTHMSECGRFWVLGMVRAGGLVEAGEFARVRLPSTSFRALPAL